MAVTINGTSGIVFNDGTAQSSGALNAISAAALGAVGTYAFLQLIGATATEGSTVAGSSLRYAGLNTGGFSTGGTPSGTWRLMGSLIGGNDQASLWLRIS